MILFSHINSCVLEWISTEISKFSTLILSNKCEHANRALNWVDFYMHNHIHRRAHGFYFLGLDPWN
jgi:hypothetical protein